MIFVKQDISDSKIIAVESKEFNPNIIDEAKRYFELFKQKEKFRRTFY